jgi:hypothetical protein
MPDSYEKTWLRVVRKINNLIKTIAKIKTFQYENVKDRGIEEGIKFAIGTIGMGQIGDRAPVNHTNLQAYVDMLQIYKLWAEKYGDEKTKEIFEVFLRAAETELFARSHTEKTILGAVAEALSRFDKESEDEWS